MYYVYYCHSFSILEPYLIYFITCTLLYRNNRDLYTLENKTTTKEETLILFFIKSKSKHNHRLLTNLILVLDLNN